MENKQKYITENKPEFILFREKLIQYKDFLRKPSLKQYNGVLSKQHNDILIEKNLVGPNNSFEFNSDKLDEVKYKSLILEMFPNKKQRRILMNWLNTSVRIENKIYEYLKKDINIANCMKRYNIYMKDIELTRMFSNELKKELQEINENGQITEEIINKTMKKIDRMLKYEKRIEIMQNRANNTYNYIYTDVLDFFNLRAKMKNKIGEIIEESKIKELNNVSKIPVHMADTIINRVCTNIRSIFTNYIKGNIKRFRIRYKKFNTNKGIQIEKEFIKEHGIICGRNLGKIKYMYKEGKKYEEYELTNKNTVNLHYDEKTKKLHLHVSVLLDECERTNKKQSRKKKKVKKKKEKEKGNQINTNEFVAIDGGVRTFLTCMNNTENIEIGTQIHSTIVYYIKKIEEVENNINIIDTVKKKKILKYNRKIDNYVTELHWKSINYLINNYKIIVIGELNIKSIISKKNIEISKMTKKIMVRLCHGKFKQRLKYKCAVNDIKINLIDERWTTKTCTQCGNYKKELKGEKIYECKKCNLVCGRDYQSCNSMLIKAII